MNDEPGRRQIVLEIAIYALLFLVVGGAIVALQVARKGDGLLRFDPHGHRVPVGPTDPGEHGR